MKLFDAELKVMEVLWSQGALAAGQLAKILKDDIGWNRNTTYTVIKKLVDKGAVQRTDPQFICKALISREQVQEQETIGLINKMFNGSTELFFSSFINANNLSDSEIEKLKQIVENLKK
ncbi:BlaI/MecI/CopY family transcriptional regulator [Paenibacillus lentus]|uniref:BlaI/MecI/CopY family transcriptional regulator n=1 Tax=Paenibacillus lentus TaxID=1338368 RepID=A0A3S8RQE1_9BACL|nr:BlaI/MecI/CopY family transcriptional regulator [Paenibacillus lentus]AZK45148.1 BlaI/MecI/CopY family transcriptional regulator [Paenibacillus lentus]